MKGSLKVAKWEFKKNIKNKSFVFSLFLTPLLFIVFSMLPDLMDGLKGETELPKVYVRDEIGVWDSVAAFVEAQNIEWEVKVTEDEADTILDEVKVQDNSAFIHLDESALEEGKVTIVTNEEMDSNFAREASLLVQPLQLLQLNDMELSAQQIERITNGMQLETIAITENAEQTAGDPLERLVPGIFAGIILFSIVFTGMMIFQSASQEKKEKVAEIVLSSLKPAELMQGKIIGYFALGITQVAVWILVILPFMLWKYDFPIMQYLLVPETILLLFIALLGYLLFAAIFAGIGATFEDVDQTSNFQGLVFMLPFLPAVFIGPVLADPEGLMAQIGTYFPITAPAILLLRLAVMEVWPWTEIFISLAVLIAGVWIMMKIAGKIFTVGILIYGKNASPKEILRWLKY